MARNNSSQSECEHIHTQMENTTEPTSEAPAENTGAENTNAILSIEDLTSSFMEKVEEQSEESTQTDAVEETDATEAVESEEEQEGEVLSQTDNETEEDSIEESDDGEIESTEPKGLQKALKRINQLTARAKGAEEEVASLKNQIQSLQSNPAQSNNSTEDKPALDKVSNIADLEVLRKEAAAAKKWALSNLGKNYVEVDGKEYSDDDIRNILTEAEEHLTEKIPQRAQFLQQKQQWVQDTVNTFPWSAKGEGAEWELFVQIRDGAQYKPLLDGLPNGDFVAATLVEGINSIKSRQAKAKTSPKTAVKKPPITDPADAVAPPSETKKVRNEKKRKAILGKGNVSVKQFAQYLNT